MQTRLSPSLSDQDITQAAKSEEDAHVLRLSPFDVLMLIDERPGYPMCFFIETQISGDLSLQRLQTAVKNAVQRHPRLRSTAQHDTNGWRWMLSKQIPEVVQLKRTPHRESQAIAFRPFNLRHEPGIRFIVIPEDSPRWNVVLQVHHSVCDGLAALEFLGDTWSFYHGNAPAAFRTDSKPKKNQPPLISDTQTNVKSDHQYTRQTIAFATFRPSSIASSCSTKDVPHTIKPFHSFTLAPTTVKSIRQRASKSGATTNDLIVTASILAIHEWNRRKGKTNKRIRITMPVNLRPPRERQPASNQIGYAFLDRTPKQLHQPKEVIKSVAEASRWIQKSGAAGMFLVVLSVFVNRTWLLRFITRLPTCFSTAVVSNVGNVHVRMRAKVPKVNGRDKPGELTITNIAGVPPVRPGTALSIGITTYSGQLTITTMTDSSRLSPSDGVELAALIKAQLEHDGTD